ncbi:alpha beta-hydrolase [Rhizoctonia solani]|uniref:Alpha beta-hydrolase n=1 Tax=Rhizoctonia solani TaxID=456999 RepID=A0A8H7IGI5_9AGAM|nr:alpha beta-hydrolase [Rhizoctonia solani]
MGTNHTAVKATYTPSIHSRQSSNASTISWSACPDSSNTQCAIFEVPMDYTNPENGKTVSIFMRKYAATAPEDQRLGSILVNPGVRSTSTTCLCILTIVPGSWRVGTAYLAIRGEDISIMVDGRYDIISFDPRGVNLTGPPTACYDTEYKFAQKMYQLNAQEAPFPHIGERNHDMLTNSGTVAVAKDMERIVQALGEDGLNFLGYSYGSILGATFAAMRPHLVKRMVLDGISDAETIAGFVSTCIEAGPTECALASRKDNKTETVEGLTKRIDALYTKLGKEPGCWGLGDWAWYHTSQQRAVCGIFLCIYPRIVETASHRLGGTGEAQYPVLCGDSPRLNVTVEEYADYFRDMGKNNSTGEPVALIVGGCRDWPFRATERYTGPWSVDKGLNKTRFPILLVSTDADPVTPLPSALKMNRAFGASLALY